MKKGDEVVCINTYDTLLDDKIVYEVSNTSLDGKYITIYGYTKLYSIKRFKNIHTYRKEVLNKLISGIKKDT